MEKEVLTKDKTQANINVPASGETSQTYTQNSSTKLEDPILKRKLGFRNKFLPIFLLLLILFTIIVGFAFMKLRGQIDTSNTIPQSSSITTKISPTATPVAEMPTNTQSITQIPKPIYKSGELLTFVHFAQGFSIGYPADLIPELRGAGGGNFFLEIGDKSNKSSINKSSRRNYSMVNGFRPFKSNKSFKIFSKRFKQKSIISRRKKFSIINR